MASRKLKSTDAPVREADAQGRVKAANAPEVPDDLPDQGDDSHPGAKRTKDFLFPKMPGAFRPTVIRKMPVEWLRDRYIQVISASMANHSMALFYCCWTQEQFEAAMTRPFKKSIERAKAQLADRATFIMHRNLGLIEGEAGSGNTQVTSALARVVESLKAKEVDLDEGGGFKLVVQGLDRSAAPPAAERPA